MTTAVKDHPMIFSAAMVRAIRVWVYDFRRVM